MSQLVFFLEEPSAKAMLEGLLPRLLPENIYPRFVVFEGKQDLEKQLPRKLRVWQTPATLFVVLRDKDRGDCVEIKSRLVNKCCTAGKPDTLVRIACHELESWYLGDLNAVEQGLQINALGRRQNRRNYLDPDRLATPAKELKYITQKKYHKVAGSRSIGPHLSLETNRSHSFNVFVAGVRRITEEFQ